MARLKEVVAMAIDREESQYRLIAECCRRHLPTLQRLAKLGTTWNRTRAPVGCRNCTSSIWMAANDRSRKDAPRRNDPRAVMEASRPPALMVFTFSPGWES